VANVGLNEARFGVEFLAEHAKKTGVTYISANLVRKGETKPVLEPYVIRSVGGLRVGIIGLLDAVTPVPREIADKGLEVLDPIDAASMYVPKVRKKADLVVVLGYLYTNRAREVAERVKGIDIILHRGSRMSTQPEKVGDTILAPAGRLSGHVAELELTFAPAGSIDSFVGDVVQLHESSPRDREMLAEVDEILNRQTREQRARAAEAAQVKHVPIPESHDGESGKALDPEALLREKAKASLAGWQQPIHATADLVAGTASCRTCHEAETAAWEAGPHARAFATLAATEDWSSVQCLPCHTSGYGTFAQLEQDLPAPEYWNVQCEECHGPGKAHAEDPTKKMGSVKTSTCQACHTAEWSPDFDDAAARAALSHGH
jgi:hypothetical protein